MLQRRLISGANNANEADPDTEAGGESMNLDMQLSERGDGGLIVTTAGQSATPESPTDLHRVNRQLAQDEENILRHRDPADPGYSDYDHDYHDREPEL